MTEPNRLQGSSPVNNPITSSADYYVALMDQMVAGAKRKQDFAKVMLVGYASATVLALTAAGYLNQQIGLGPMALGFGLSLFISLVASTVDHVTLITSANTHINWCEMQAVEVRAGRGVRADWDLLKDKNYKILEGAEGRPTYRLWTDLPLAIGFLYFATSPLVDKAVYDWLWNLIYK